MGQAARRRTAVQIKRVYDPPAASDGTRILVDRLWPRGVSKARAKVDLWLREIAPSTALRRWYGHDPARWAEFRRRYARELREQPEGLRQLRAATRRGRVTLLFSSRERKRNNAEALRRVL